MLLPDPLRPTSASTVPLGTTNDTPRTAGSPSAYENDT